MQKQEQSKAASGDPVVYTLPFALPGLNSKGGLMRSHWSSRNKLKEAIQWEIIGQGIVQFEGQVRIEYTRYSKRLMDFDNLAASSKHIFDALVKCGVIADDSPKVIPECPKWLQEKGEPRTEIKIFRYEKET